MPRENSFSDGSRSITPDLELPHNPAPEQPADASASVHDRAHPDAHPLQISGAAGHDHNASSALTGKHSSKQSVHSLASKRSLRNRISFHRPDIHGSAPAPSSSRFATPGDRFRSAVNRVMAMRRTSYIISGSIAGAEPGVDPRRANAYQQYGHLRAKCVIDVHDYSPLRTTSARMGNTEFLAFLKNDAASARPPWVKVRWINVGGLSWDVLSELAIKYDMHPLALEDLIHQSNRARSKADYYAQHLFIRVLSHTLGSSEEEISTSELISDISTLPSWSSRANTLTNMPRSSSPTPLDQDEDEKKDIDVDEERPDAPYDLEAGMPRSSSLLSRTRKQRVTHLTLEELKRGDRVNVRIAPFCIFLFKDGTVLSFLAEPSLEFTEPIANRLKVRDSTLRRSGDASLLAQSLIDIIVDRVLEVVDEYHRRIQQLERDVLIRPEVSCVRALHILSGDLTLHKRTMDPIRTLVYGLRRYDADRYAAVMQTEAGAKPDVSGYISHKANIYLADVHDHMEYALASLDMYAALTENLIAYTFNMASYDMNQSMRSLTLVTIIFFPLTLLTGYFGMNFQGGFFSIEHSDLFFWEIALPLMAVIIPIFLRSDIVRAAHYVKKKLVARRIRKAIAPKPKKA